MALSVDLITQFAKITKPKEETNKETTVYGTIKMEEGGETFVRLDGASENELTPISSTTVVKDGDRVAVLIKNHTATVTGNLTKPSATNDSVENAEGKVNSLSSQIEDFDIIIANKVDTDTFDAEVARIDTLVAENVTIKESLTAAEGDIDTLQSSNVTITEQLTAQNASIENLKTTKLDVTIAEATYATIEDLEATNLDVYNLESTYADFSVTTTDRLTALEAVIDGLEVGELTVESLSGRFANIDFSNIGVSAMQYFYSNSGLIEDVTISNGTITGRIVGVTISGDRIEGNTIVAEKLVIKGEDGLYYKLNTDGVTTEAEQTAYNSLNGNVILANSITATKINVDDLVAFDATIGGFNITENSIYSGAKASVGNTTRGIYLDNDGQIAFGDSIHYVKFYKDENGTYKLAISADNILLGSNSKSVETAISDVQSAVDNIEIGGRNLLINSATKKISPYLETSATHEYGVEVTEWVTTEASRMYGTGGTSTIFGTMGGTSCHCAASEDQMYSASIYIKNNHATNTVTVTGNHLSGLYVDIAPLESKRVELVGSGNGCGYLQFNFKTAVAGDEFDITYWHPKIEFGNKPTDWTPAPEDMATADDLEMTQATAESAEEKANSAESLIQQLTDNISMLVTDGNGTSLMTQTDEGWTFSTAELRAAVDRTSEGLSDLTNDVGDVSNTVDILQQAVDELGPIKEYVKIGTYEDEPCIELGESDSDFKLIITNTRIMFMEGADVPAYINNQSLNIKKAVIEEELQQGNFVWKIRSNGNMGLVWKGEA